jgi:hypothetical protein
MVKKEETNDIIQFLIQQLENIWISMEYCKIAVTTEKSKGQRGDVWISSEKQDSVSFEKKLLLLLKLNVGIQI